MTALQAPAAQAPVTLAPPSLARLVQIELRKAVDTRAGRWLLVVIALVALGTAILTAVTGDVGDRNLPHVLGDAVQLASILLPVLGVLLVTSEWSQHTALTTFTLVPRRSRIIAAKLTAGLLLAAAATGRWLDPSTAWNHLADAGTVTATMGAQVATAAAVWIALPVLAGGWRVLHRPVDA